MLRTHIILTTRCLRYVEPIQQECVCVCGTMEENLHFVFSHLFNLISKISQFHDELILLHTSNAQWTTAECVGVLLWR